MQKRSRDLGFVAVSGQVLPLFTGFLYDLRQVRQAEVFNGVKELSSHSPFEIQ